MGRNISQRRRKERKDCIHSIMVKGDKLQVEETETYYAYVKNIFLKNLGCPDSKIRLYLYQLKLGLEITGLRPFLTFYMWAKVSTKISFGQVPSSIVE